MFIGIQCVLLLECCCKVMRLQSSLDYLKFKLSGLELLKCNFNYFDLRILNNQWRLEERMARLLKIEGFIGLSDDLIKVFFIHSKCCYKINLLFEYCKFYNL